MAADPATVFSALAEIIYHGSDVEPDLRGHLRRRDAGGQRGATTPACWCAATVATSPSAPATALRSGSTTWNASAGDGPCVDAIEEETPQIETDLTTPNQWPKLAARMVAETPVRGAMGFRILVDKRKTGALNLFSDKAGVFDTESAGQAIVLASFASVAINAVAQGEDVSTLRRGLMSNREIGKAVGMLMMLHGVDEQEAFDVLRRYSQDLNIKLADVARTVIESRGKPIFGGGDRSLGKS